MIKYNLTKSELRDVKKACAYFKLHWEVIAARPVIARQLINEYNRNLPENV